MAEELDYIPMPDSVVKLIEKTWNVRHQELSQRIDCAPSSRGAVKRANP